MPQVFGSLTYQKTSHHRKERDQLSTKKRRRSSSSAPRLVVIPLIVAAAAVSGCEDDPTVQQDRYKSLTECMADWGNEELCMRAPTSEARTAGGSTSYIYTHPYYFYGPTYYPHDRVYTDPHTGNSVRPGGSNAFDVAKAPASSFNSKPGVASSPGKSGGFGATGARAAAAGKGGSGGS